MYVCGCVCVYASVGVWMCASARVCVFASVYVCACCVPTRACVCISVYPQVSARVCVRACVHACVRACVCHVLVDISDLVPVCIFTYVSVWLYSLCVLPLITSCLLLSALFNCEYISERLSWVPLWVTAACPFISTCCHYLCEYLCRPR